MTNNELEPCYSCPNGVRVWHDIGIGNDGYETVVCICKKNCLDCGREDQ